MLHSVQQTGKYKFQDKQSSPHSNPHRDFAEKSAIIELKNITVSVYSHSKFDQAAVETARDDLFPYWREKEA